MGAGRASPLKTSHEEADTWNGETPGPGEPWVFSDRKRD